MRSAKYVDWNTCYSSHNELLKKFQVEYVPKAPTETKTFPPRMISLLTALWGLTLCCWISTDMTIPCWLYLCMAQATMNREIIPPSIFTFVHSLISSTISTKLWKFNFIHYVITQASFQKNCPLAPLYRFWIPAQISGFMNYLTSPHFKFLLLKVETVMTQPLHHR